ncbi:MAG: hypothetical protein LBR18_08695, partial [Tannerella sp.]|nr:hypothetical protein [Tannerella sp.]
MKHKSTILILTVLLLVPFFGTGQNIQSLAEQFRSQPEMKYRPQAWWHWLGTNYSKEGITKDLRAM